MDQEVGAWEWSYWESNDREESDQEVDDQSQKAATELAPRLEDGDEDEDEEDNEEAEEEEEEEEKGPRLENCAVASNGWGMALPKGVDGHKLTIVLARRPPFPRKVHWRQAAEKMQAIGRQPWRKSFSLTSQERHREPYHEIGTKVFRYILVGFALVGLEAEFSTLAPSFRQKGANATDDSGWCIAPATIIPDAEARGVVMVVAITGTAENPQLRARLFALLEPKHGLCTPYRICASECFYLPMFRYLHLATGRVTRKWEAWNVVVRDASVLPPPTATEPVDMPQAAEGSKLFTSLDVDQPEDSAGEQDAASERLDFGVVGRKRMGSDTSTKHAQIKERKKGESNSSK